MLIKQVCRFNDKKKGVERISVPVEKADIIGYIEEQIETIENYFKYNKSADFLYSITFLRHTIVAFGDLDILTYEEFKEYLLKHAELCERYKDLKKI